MQTINMKTGILTSGGSLPLSTCNYFNGQTHSTTCWQGGELGETGGGVMR
jgi:hypothetical protein